LERAENITTSAGGVNTESDAAYYRRMRENFAALSTAGPADAYVYLVKSASALIKDAVAVSPSPGVVDIRLLTKDGMQLTQEMEQIVLRAVTADDKRPLTDFVSVSYADTVPFDIALTYFISKPNEDGATAIRIRAEAAVEEYIEWQTEKLGRDVDPSELNYKIKAAGIKRVEITSPEFMTVPPGAVAVLGEKAVIYGGIEDE
jgi:phage-related baseplate assembly protein